MKIAIIGAGNMGGAIARGMAKGTKIETSDIIVANPSQGKLDALKQEFPLLNTTNDNAEAARQADCVIVCVKPWLMQEVVSALQLSADQLLVSVAAGITFEQLAQFAGVKLPMYRLIPNTAISQLESLTVVAGCGTTAECDQWILDVFNEMGLALMVQEKQMAAATALTSCGIAYVLKYIQAAMQAGIEMGLYPKVAQQMVAQSVKGAAALLLNNDTHPSVEIDKVCTPGGLTIKGINELEHAGFTSAVIRAMKASR